MKALAAVGALALILVVVLKLRPTPPGPGPSRSPSASAAPPVAAGPLWPLEVGHSWVYSETRSDKPGTNEVTVTVTAEERTGFRLVEERGGKGSSTDLIETRDDGFAFAEYESAKETTLLLPKKAPQVRDWSCRSDMRAAISRDTEFTLDGRAYPAFDVRYEKKTKGPDGGESWREQMAMTFAPGLGIVRKDTTQQEGGKGYVWELLRFTPAKK